MSKASRIDVYGSNNYTPSFFDTKDNFTKYFPVVRRDLIGFMETLNEITDKAGLDFEFPPSYRPTIIGISSYKSCAAVRATPDLVAHVVREWLGRKVKMVGHSFTGAEKEVIRVSTGIEAGVETYDDTMLKHFLLNADLAKSPDKGEDDSGALGYMNLWSAVSLELLVPNWKNCRGIDCEQVICPSHDSFGYCAVDAWSSLALDKVQEGKFQTHKIPTKLYEELKELTEIAVAMQKQGVKINMPFVNELEKKSTEYKEKLFADKNLFNPRAPQQVVEWFNERGTKLVSNTKKDIQKALEKEAQKYGFNTRTEDGKFTIEDVATSNELKPVLDALYRLYEYKTAGKGLDPWFAEEYRDKEDFIHPRFITTGASTGRWSSSRPNFQNIPARGFGSLVKGCIVPRDESLDLIASDISNLELRVVTYLGGVDPAILGDDPFRWLVSQSNGAFDKVASLVNDTPRFIAKSVSYGSIYGEGIKILKSRDFARENIKKEIEYGSLRVHKDWEYCGGIVAFTGANLAERLFGDKSQESRKRALEILEDIFFKQMPFLRDWQKKVLQEIESTKMVRYPTGHFLRLYGTPEENAKVGCAALGQGIGATHVQGILLRYVRELNAIPCMFVHDSLEFEIPVGWSDDKAREFLSIMGQETDRLPGFKTPFKAFRGKSLLEDKMTRLI